MWGLSRWDGAPKCGTEQIGWKPVVRAVKANRGARGWLNALPRSGAGQQRTGCVPRPSVGTLSKGGR